MDLIFEIKESGSIGFLIILVEFISGETIIISFNTSNADMKSTFVSEFKTLICL